MTIKKLVNDKPLWDDFLEVLDSKIDVAQRRLEQETSIEGVYRAQGEIAALRRLTYLRDEVNA
jgi:7-keto-8-aminopelargonate synthetase-like enzyme|tara:strand:+ start:47 stop:235 length:189 start_codon:yes stop_codon:yes gene_type:complete